MKALEDDNIKGEHPPTKCQSMFPSNIHMTFIMFIRSNSKAQTEYNRSKPRQAHDTLLHNISPQIISNNSKIR